MAARHSREGKEAMVREMIEFSKDGLWVRGEKIIPMCAEFHYWRMEPRWWDDVLGRLIKGPR